LKPSLEEDSSQTDFFQSPVRFSKRRPLAYEKKQQQSRIPSLPTQKIDEILPSYAVKPPLTPASTIEKILHNNKQQNHYVVSSPINQEHKAHLDIPADISLIPKMREVTFEKNLKDKEGKIKEEPIDEDIIILDDSDSPKKTRQKTKDFVKHDERSAESLCTFQRESITRHDYKTLAEDEFLNDNIINFYLTWLFQNLDTKFKDIVHIYSSHFYSRLKRKPDKKNKNDKNDKEKTKAEKCYDQVKGWTKKIDIFEKRMLIFPICEESHWYLVIVCNPGHVLSQSREKDFEAKRSYQQKYGETRGFNPFIMVLDSLGGNHSSAVSRIRSYLTFEYIAKRKIPKNFGKEKMSEKHPPIPLQPNSCDCGLFLLHYVELIFKDPEVFLGAMLPDLSKWFNTTDIDFKREDIAMLIQKISNDTGKDLIFPRIRFPARRKKPQDDGAIDVDKLGDEDVPLSKKRVDPRLKKTVKDGSLGELLKSKIPSLPTMGRSSRFTGNYRESSPPSRRSTPPASPQPESPKLFDSPKQKISFEIKKRIHAPKTPEEENFSSKSSKNGRSSWESVPKDKSGKMERLEKRFTLKRDNEDTNPDKIKKRKERDENGQKTVRSSKEMYDILMKSSTKKKRKTQEAY